MKVTVEMLQNLGVCGPASTYVGQWFVDNNVQIIDYDLGMAYLKSLIGHGQAWINENVADEDHADYINWIAWYEKLPTDIRAITYFGDHIIENTFKVTADDSLHESIEAARAHIARLVNELRDDYNNKIILNGVYLNEEGYETWEVINNPYKENLSRFTSFVWHDPETGINNRTNSATAAIAYYDMIHNTYNTMIDQYRDACKIQQQYMDEARKYTVWVTVE